MIWGWILFLAVITLCVLVVVRSIKPQAKPYVVGGLLWFVERGRYWGPCCEKCLVQHMLRPASNSPEGVLYYALVCPLCLEAMPGQAFTLQALLEMETRIASLVKGRRAGIGLAPIEAVDISAPVPKPLVH